MPNALQDRASNLVDRPAPVRTNGSRNKLALNDRLAHDWYRFVLSFPPHLVREYVNKFDLSAGDLVLDPFCGTGTTLVECKKLCLTSSGVEATPLGYLASSVKTDWSPCSKRLIAHATRIAEDAWDILESTGTPDECIITNNRPTKPLRKLPEEVSKLLLSESISHLPLHKTLVLLEVLEKNRDSRYYRHEQLALAKALVASIGNLRFGPEVGLGPKKDDAPVVRLWLEQVTQMAEDIATLEELPNANVTVHNGDARQLGQWLKPNSIASVITSPPYPNEKDYTRTTRLETVLLGFIRSKTELQALKKRLIRSNTRGVYKCDDDDSWIKGHPEIAAIADRIEAKRLELGKDSGFERLYARVTKLYFGGMARHLADLRPFLRPGARLAYVVGDQASYLQILIRTGQLLAQIAEQLGYRVENIELFRTRLATATRQQLREEVLILRWPGK